MKFTNKAAAATTNATQSPGEAAAARALKWFTERKELVDARDNLGKIARGKDAEVQRLLDSVSPDAAGKIAEAEGIAAATRRLAEQAEGKIRNHDASINVVAGRLHAAIAGLREECLAEIEKSVRAQLTPILIGNFDADVGQYEINQIVEGVVRKSVALRAEVDRHFWARSLNDVSAEVWLRDYTPGYLEEVFCLQRRLEFFRRKNATGEPIGETVPAECVCHLSHYQRATKKADPKYIAPDTPAELRQKYLAAKEGWRLAQADLDSRHLGNGGLGYSPEALGLIDPDKNPRFAEVRDLNAKPHVVKGAPILG